MKRWGLLLGALLLLALFVASREHFSATATIKNPNSWDAAELTRIKGLVTPASTLPDADIRRVVGGFWSVWEAATNRITTADITEYLSTLNLGLTRGSYQDLIRAYYIQQGESVFQTASGYSSASTSSGNANPPSPPSDTAASSAATTVERPSTSTQSLRQLIATTAGIPANQDASINPFITQVQKFYDTVYLPDKVTPTYTQVMGFVDGADTTLLPAAIQNNFKVYLSTILQSYFTPAAPVTEAGTGGGATAGAADFGDDATGGAGAEQWAGTGKNVQGPGSGGIGTGNSTGGLGIPRNYPVLYGGMQSYESALPSSESLGTNANAKFAPYSRVPGDQDVYPDPYRLGKFFSTSSYSASDKPEPAPFLADFSKFFT